MSAADAPRDGDPGGLSQPARLRIATQQIATRANPAGISIALMFWLYLRRLAPLKR
jgi:hypothetical protein